MLGVIAAHVIRTPKEFLSFLEQQRAQLSAEEYAMLRVEALSLLDHMGNQVDEVIALIYNIFKSTP